MMLNLDNLDYLFSSSNMIIRSETWLLNRLFKWYITKMNYNQSNENTNKFKNLIENNFHSDKIDETKIESSFRKSYNDLNINIKVNKRIHYIDLCNIENEKIQDMIVEYYSDDRILQVEEMKLFSSLILPAKQKIISELLTFKETKVNEIGIMIVKESDKLTILSKLCSEYNTNHRKRTIFCICLFVNNYEEISVIHKICGLNLLFDILNLDKLLDKRVLINYIRIIPLSREEEKEMKKIINNEELLKELLIKEITSFSYPHSQYSFVINEEISIIPSFDGDKCKFSINPCLPDGIILDKRNGLIYGKVENEMENTEYEIICRNTKSEKKFKIYLEFHVEREYDDEISLEFYKYMMEESY